MPSPTKKIIRSPIINANGPQNGAVTHHHDQLITPTSLSTTKATPSIPEIGKLVPNKVPAYKFEEGIAEIECIHERENNIYQP